MKYSGVGGTARESNAGAGSFGEKTLFRRIFSRGEFPIEQQISIDSIAASPTKLVSSQLFLIQLTET